MAIYKKDKTWYIDYYENGHRRREAVGPNRKTAESILAKRKVQVVEGRFLDVKLQSKVTFDELAARYMEYAKANKLSWERDSFSIKRLSVKFSGRRLNQITTMAIDDYKAERLKEVAPATVNRELACLKHMFTKAIQWNQADLNPVKSVRMLKERNARLRYLKPDEVDRLLDAIDQKFEPVVRIALYTGMRRGEILGLRWTDIDILRGLIFIRDSKNGEKREIPISSHLSKHIRQLPQNGDFVFDPADGYNSRSLRSAYERALRQAAINDFTFHDLRHTFASHLVMSGVDLLTVKELLGHKSITMTLRYAHLSPDHKKNAVEQLEYSDGHYMDTRKKAHESA